jgi:probable O-glycosylation ligase (exosortase A-associated)
MKQTALMLALLIVGTFGTVLLGPFIGVSIYYLFAVLRPQLLWEWALPEGVRWSFFVGAATVAMTLIYLPGTFRTKTLSRSHILMLGFAVWVTLSHVFAKYADVSSRWYWEYLTIFAMFFCASVVIREFAQVKILYLIAVFSIGYMAYEVNFLYLVEHRLDIYLVGLAGLDNNGAGLMIAMGIPMAYFLWQGYKQWWRWIFIAMIPVMLHAVLMSYSRGAMVSLLVASPLVILRSRRKQGMLLFLAGLVFLVPILAGQEIRDRFFSTTEYQQDESAQSRLASWKAGWGMIKDHPLFGVGLKVSDVLSYEYGADVPGRAIHSQYVQIAADSGLPAITFYLLLLFSSWRSLRRAQKRCRRSTAETEYLAYNLAAGLEGALVVFCIGASFLSLDVFELPYLLILLATKLPLTLPEKQTAITSPVAVPEVGKRVASYAKA